MLPVLLFAATAWAANIDINAGGNWNQYKTSLLPGDILTLHPQTPGQPYTYTLTGSNSFTLNGSPTKPIIVQGAPGEKVTIAMNDCQNVVELKGTYFKFQNLILTALSGAPGAIGLRLNPNVTNAIIDSVTIYNIPETAFTANSHGGYYDNVTFSNCEVYNTGGTGECFYVGCQNTGSTEFLCQFKNGFLINNYCHDTCSPDPCTGGSMGSGYQVKGWGSYNNVVRNNVCARVAQVCILMYDDFDLGPNIVEGNWIYGSIGDAGIQVSAGAIIRNNVISGNSNGIVITSNSANLYPGKSPRKIQVVGNTIVNNGGLGIDIAALNPTAGSRFVNNVVIEDSGNAFNARASQSGVSWMKNAYYGGSAPSGVTASTGLVSVGASGTIFQNVAGYNFHPKAGAALLGAGAALTGSDSTIDFSCVTRNTNTPTIGAYETTTGAALPLDFLPPCSAGAPTNPPTAAPTIANQPTSAPTTPCFGINCGAHGACVDPNPVCVCTDSYTGARCENPPPDPCVGNPPAVDCGAHGTCSNGVCTCFGNYTGTLCTTPPPPTCTDGVQNSDEAGIDCGGTNAKCPPCPTYYWNPNNWTACSVSCGGGTQTRTVDCINSATGGVVAASYCSAAPHGFTTTQSCNVDPCATYSWRTGMWDTCSAPCGTGFQTRAVDCISSAGNVTVPDSFCTGTKPITTQNCNTVACVAPHWVTGTWSPCSLACGGGTQTRSRQCYDAQDNLVADSMCSPPTPATSQPCNTDACVNYNWKACPTFYPCTAQCNGGGAMVGQQFRDVFCIRDTDNSAVDVALCDNTTKPGDLLTVCNTQPCTNYNWMADSNFGPCVKQPSGVYQRFRTFHCHAANGALALRSDCEANAGKLPIAVLPCTPGTCASPEGCPIVEIADLFNQCLSVSMLTSCVTTSPCGVAANLLDTQLSSLGFTNQAGASQQCVNEYVASLGPNDVPKSDLLSYVNSKVNTGAKLCIPTTSDALAIAPGASVFLALAIFFTVR